MKFLFIFFAIFQLSNAVTIDCNYHKDGDWWAVTLKYYCEVTNDLNINSKDMTDIDGVNGELPSGITLDDIQGVNMENLTTFYFPKGLEKIFKNLLMIDINYGRLKEIHQNDFSPFPQLKSLELFENDIEVLEDDLFKFNPNLEMIWLSSNKIFHVSPTAFAAIKNLRYISFDSNPCASQYVQNNATAAKIIVENAIKNCVDQKELEVKFPSLIKTIKSIEKALVILDEKIENKSLNRIVFERKVDENSNNLGLICFMIGGFLFLGVIIGIMWMKFKEILITDSVRVKFNNSNEIQM
ncbi:hypothetical protein PVAND_016892 [Polypedilum vanderplanki]|uniref:Uncharacterized protein n=1 Tax=Polypedilum vanderplanki TaxID=319348 RepID=A0A9J6BGQ9_POLVA|nr:hypothetical protein PVAND_016892 [Polypedilum vanderplanki]